MPPGRVRCFHTHVVAWPAYYPLSVLSRDHFCTCHTTHADATLCSPPRCPFWMRSFFSLCGPPCLSSRLLRWLGRSLVCETGSKRKKRQKTGRMSAFCVRFWFFYFSSLFASWFFWRAGGGGAGKTYRLGGAMLAWATDFRF